MQAAKTKDSVITKTEEQVSHLQGSNLLCSPLLQMAELFFVNFKAQKILSLKVSHKYRDMY